MKFKVYNAKKKQIMPKNYSRYDGSTGCVKIQTNYTENFKDWMESLKKKALPGSLPSPPPPHTNTHLMGKNGLEPISYDCTLAKLEIQRRTALNIYAIAKDTKYCIERTLR